MTVVKAAEHRTIDLLVASGVHMDTWTLPEELYEPKTGAPISHDDIIDFHSQLHNDNVLVEALSLIHI